MLDDVKIEGLSLPSKASCTRLISQPVRYSYVRSSIDIETIVNSKENGCKPEDNKDNDHLNLNQSIDSITIKMHLKPGADHLIKVKYGHKGHIEEYFEVDKRRCSRCQIDDEN